MTLYDRLVDMMYAVHPFDRRRCYWALSQPMADYLADMVGQKRGPADGAYLLGRPCRLANDPGGLRLELEGGPGTHPGTPDG